MDRSALGNAHLERLFESPPPADTFNWNSVDTKGDDFKIGFPMITVRKSDAFAFDIELVPGLDFDDDGPVGVPLTIHPGVLQDDAGGDTSGSIGLGIHLGVGFSPTLARHIDGDVSSLRPIVIFW
jgi:hypothetical protein